MHAPASLQATDGPEPAWEIARLFPAQGAWSVDDFLSLDTNHPIEFTDGCVEVLPMPTKFHQRIAQFLYELLRAVTGPTQRGEVFTSGYKVQVGDTAFRNPDVFFIAAEHADWALKYYATGADLVIEVVSEDNRSQKRDWDQKRLDYAKARIPEYWIVDELRKKIVALKLVGDTYETHCEAGETGRVTSALLPGFEVDAAAVWAAAQGA